MTPPAASSTDVFVQVGATRDGLDPYLACARRRGLTAALVETPAFLRWRRTLGRQPFDLELAVDQPDDPAAVARRIQSLDGDIRLVLTGFERYADTAFALARRLQVAPWPACGRDFVPVTKLDQRRRLAVAAPGIAQPAFACQSSPTFDQDVASIPFPQVVKPVDGGGGLGVFYAADGPERDEAMRALRGVRNYDGAEFRDVLVEGFIAGPEFSIQGVVHNGRPEVLSVCEKLVARETSPHDGVSGFREVGHIARPGLSTPAVFARFADQCLAAMGYEQGPFHIDAIDARDGTGLTFVEMGFRLSGGGLVSLVHRTTGIDWADLAFAAHLGIAAAVTIRPGTSRDVVGQVTVVNQDEFDRAAQLRRAGHQIEVQRSGPPPGQAAPSGDDALRLRSDRSRHSGLGRVIMHGEIDTVRRALVHCVAERLAM